MLRLEDRWVWDSWVVDDGERYHLFYLQAPRSLGDAGLRHTHATVGHASSTDLVSWTVHPDALGPGAAGELGRPGDLDRLGGPGRRRGLADVLHGDLERAARAQGPADRAGRVRRPDDVAPGRRPAGRRGGPALVQVAGRRRAGQRDLARPAGLPRPRRGRLAHARHGARGRGRRATTTASWRTPAATTCDAWAVGPPLCRPGAGFGQLEVPQVAAIDGRYVLVFTCHPARADGGAAEAVGRLLHLVGAR